MNTVLKISEVAALYRVSDMTVRRWIKQGEITVIRVGGTTRIPTASLPPALTVARCTDVAVGDASPVSAVRVEASPSGAAVAAPVGRDADDAPAAPTSLDGGS